jgi:two-component system CheB/CheR fusion protein
MIRNLLSNALKYTKQGKLLLGCRRCGSTLRIEVWDTGIGIPQNELQTIFEEYHQLGNSARQRSLGLGLGLSIVRRVADLLGHKVQVRSQLGKGSVFGIDVTIQSSDARQKLTHLRKTEQNAPTEKAAQTGKILIVEDDLDMCEILSDLLNSAGHCVVTAVDGVSAMQCISKKAIKPDLILADYNLPNGMNGIQVSAKLREKLKEEIPIIILTGDISTETLRDIARQDCVQLNKPVRFEELERTIESLLAESFSTTPSSISQPIQTESVAENPVIFIVDDDVGVSESIRAVLEDQGLIVETFASCEAFLKTYTPGHHACLLIDAYLPGMSGIDLLQCLKDAAPCNYDTRK